MRKRFARLFPSLRFIQGTREKGRPRSLASFVGILIPISIYCLLGLLAACASNATTESVTADQSYSGIESAPVITPTETATIVPTATSTPEFTETGTGAPTEEPTLPPTTTLTPTPMPFASGPIAIGTSVAGRPIVAYRFGTGSVEKLIVYGIHGGSEFNTIQLATETIQELNAHPERIPTDISLYMVPDINPDGAARAHSSEGRANDHGVDLNRNWNNLWKPDWNRNGCASKRPISAGTYPLSEPEAQSLWRLINAHHFGAAISYHSYGTGILPAGQPWDPPSVLLAKAVAAVTVRKDYPFPPRDMGCEYTGQLSDWAASRGIPFIDLELPDPSHTDFTANLKVLHTFLLWRK